MSINHQMINHSEIRHPYCSSSQNIYSSPNVISQFNTNIAASLQYCKPTYSRSDELRVRIHENHLSYLSREETPSKFELRSKIESLITEYLSLIPHSHKFSFKEINNCLNKSVNKSDFDPNKVIDAFGAIERYATNLLNYPWRLEYRTIFAFNGFFHRTVDNNLVGYQEVLELLGFVYDPNTQIYKLIEVPIDPDKVSQLSLECLVAIVECQIMVKIYNLVKPSYPSIYWHDIHSVRTDYVCNTENAVKLIIDLKKTGKLIDLDASDYSVKKFNKIDLMSPTINNGFVPENSFNSKCILTPSNYLESNLDTFDSIEGFDKNLNKKTTNNLSYCNSAPTSTDPIKSIDSLFSNHYKVNSFGSTGLNTKRLDQAKSTPSAIGLDNSVQNRLPTLNKINRNKDNIDVNLKINSSRLNCIDSVLMTEINQFENKKLQQNNAKKVSHPQSKHTQNSESNPIENGDLLRFGNSLPKKDDCETNALVARFNILSKTKTLTQNSKLNGFDLSWYCKSCTYKNKNDCEICTMCHRSRSLGNELNPLVSGGRECSRCTLVNGKDAKFCIACETSLDDSPTYI